MHIVFLNAYFRSTDSFLSNVKFDIWDEHEQPSAQNSEIGEIITARGIDECDSESNFEYPPHPLVVSL